jgi:hypothetical protein
MFECAGHRQEQQEQQEQQEEARWREGLCACTSARTPAPSAPLVDCYFVHFKYLGCWCSGTVCEENDTETEPLHFAGCLIIETATLRAGCIARSWAGPTDSLRVVFTPLPLQRNYMWSKYMRCVEAFVGSKGMEEGEGPRGETALTNNNHGKR